MGSGLPWSTERGLAGGGTTAGQLTIRAFAKINLGFEVLGRRPDGLHEVTTVMQTIDLADTLQFEAVRETTFEAKESIPLECAAMEVRRDNLILQAAYLMKERAGIGESCRIHCTKEIPLSGGLAGGSADAAATLCALWRLWEVRLDGATLLQVAGQLGADVPFCMSGGTALATGTGREVEPLPDAPAHWVVLVPLSADNPSKTGHMYARLSNDQWTDGSAAVRQSRAIREGRLDYSAIWSAFTELAEEEWPDVRRALALLRSSEAQACSVSGAGPSCFGLYVDRAQAEALVDKLRANGLPARVCRFTRSEKVTARGTNR